MNRIKSTIVYLLLLTTYDLLLAPPAFAQGRCVAGFISDGKGGGKCELILNECEQGRSTYLGVPPICQCTCSLIPGYEDIDAFKDFKFKIGTIGEIFSAALPMVFIFAGLGVFVYLIYGGFHLMISGGEPTAIQEAKGKITNAIIGFIIIFVSYWLIQIIEVVFGMTIL